MQANRGFAGSARIALLLGLCMSPCVLTAKIIYVDSRAPGTGDDAGITWEDAYLCLQNALEVAQAGDEIRVARGVYQPDRRMVFPRTGLPPLDIEASGSVDDSFVLPEGVVIKGGYAGARSLNPDARVSPYRSILSGDLLGNDPDLSSLDSQTLESFVMHLALRDNSRTVVTATGVSSQTVLDGFTITAGHCEGGTPGSSPRSRSGTTVPSPTAQTDGAGAFIDSGSPMFIRCVFSRNTILPYTNVGAGGAGVATHNSSATFQECTFEENLAIGYDGYGYGGAVLVHEGAPQFINCTFLNNAAGGAAGPCAGGAVTSVQSDCALAECSFVGNRVMASTGRTTDSLGGAVYCSDYGHPTMADCLFEGNSARQGGAVYLDGDCEPNVIGCTFLANEATDNGRGGAVYNSSNCAGNFDGCRFLGNAADDWGGAVLAKGAPTVVSCLFSGNSAARGAGIYAEVNAVPMVINCTFSNNVAAEEGGAFCSIVGTTRFSNCILWGNAPQEIRSDTGGLQIDHSNVQGLGLSSQGNVDANPRFQDPLGADAIAGTLDDDLRLSAGSPCLDTGDDTALPAFATTDLDGLERVVGGRVDMGAYEFSGPLRYYVDAATGDDNNGGWGPREAFATIQRGIRAASEGYTVLVMPGVYTEEINFAGKAITVSGENGGAILEAPGGYAVSCYTAERSTSVLRNFVVRNSDVGIFVAGAMPTIRNVTVTGNEFGIASYAGGNPDISNCILWDNIDGDLFGCTATYSCVQQGVEGEGNIREDPLFADPEAGDYHLLSERGRFVPAHALWAFDAKTSPCVDAGDPTLDPGAERMPNGGRINMGAFGGTPQASMSEWPLAGDLNRDRRVDFADLAILLDQWLEELPAVGTGATDTSSLQPKPVRWAIDGQPREVHGGGGVFDYYVEMTAAEVVSPHGPVEYFFDCQISSELFPFGYDSGWQTARTYKVLVGRSGQGLRFRVRARDRAGNMTDWCEWAMALLAN